MPHNDYHCFRQIYLLLMAICASAVADNVLYLEFVINGRNTTQVFAVTQKENDWEISTDELKSLGVALNFPHGERLLLSEFPGASVTYDETMQRLLITVPGNALPMQNLTARSEADPTENARRDAGAFINYDLLMTDEDAESHQASLWHELYWFEQEFYAVNRGILRDTNAIDSNSSYLRFESYYQHDNQNELWGLTLGDVINATPNWGRSIRMGGIRIARDYELNPNLITYPLPEFFGESALPGSVDLLINDQLRWRDQVNPGPFSINTVPFLSGAGVAEVVTTDVQGQQARQRVNFYIASEILDQGLLDYDVTLGMRRKDFGFASDHYADNPVYSGSFRYGVTPYITPQILIQGGEHLHLAGAGFSLLASHYGVVEYSYTGSRYFDQSGYQESFAYSYSQQRIGFSARFLQHHGMYRDLGNLDDGVQRDEQWQVAFSFYQKKMGSFNLGYFQISEQDTGQREFATLSWSRYFNSGVTLFANLNRQLYGEKDNIFSLAVSIPFGYSGQASVGGQRGLDNQWRTQVQAMANAPYSGGVGWRLGADDSAEKNAFGAIDWRARRYELSASVLRNETRNQYTGEITGALVAMGGNIYSTRFITDAFALVDAKKANIPVMIGNQLVGQTGANGKLLVPDLYSYLENRISIDPDQLPANASISAIEQMVVPQRKGGVNVQFPVEYLASVLIDAYDNKEQPLPVGTVLVADIDEQEFIVGWGGEIYIEQLNEPIRLYWEDGDCVISVAPPADVTQSLPKLGRMICHPVERVGE